MQPIKQIKRRYYIQLCLYVIFAIVLIVALILFAVYRNTFSNIIIPYVLIVIFSIAEIGFLYTLFIHLKDLNSVRKNAFEQKTGTVIRYKRNQDPESGQQINTRAIICPIDSSKEIEILVTEGMTKRDGTYDFIYLKHTKIGAVKTNDLL